MGVFEDLVSFSVKSSCRKSGKGIGLRNKSSRYASLSLFAGINKLKNQTYGMSVFIIHTTSLHIPRYKHTFVKTTDWWLYLTLHRKLYNQA